MPRGGRRPNAGRKPGVPSKKTQARMALAEEALEGGVTPLEVMLERMRELRERGDEESKDKAANIAKDAAPYLHPRLSSVEQNTTLKGDTLSQLMQRIDGATTGIANGTGSDADEPPLATEQPIPRH